MWGGNSKVYHFVHQFLRLMLSLLTGWLEPKPFHNPGVNAGTGQVQVSAQPAHQHHPDVPSQPPRYYPQTDRQQQQWNRSRSENPICNFLFCLQPPVPRHLLQCWASKSTEARSEIIKELSQLCSFIITKETAVFIENSIQVKDGELKKEI